MDASCWMSITAAILAPVNRHRQYAICFSTPLVFSDIPKRQLDTVQLHISQDSTINYVYRLGQGWSCFSPRTRGNFYDSLISVAKLSHESWSVPARRCELVPCDRFYSFTASLTHILSRTPYLHGAARSLSDSARAIVHCIYSMCFRSVSGTWSESYGNLYRLLFKYNSHYIFPRLLHNGEMRRISYWWNKNNQDTFLLRVREREIFNEKLLDARGCRRVFYNLQGPLM